MKRMRRDNNWKVKKQNENKWGETEYQQHSVIKTFIEYSSRKFHRQCLFLCIHNRDQEDVNFNVYITFRR